ncbi:MAG: ATP-binding protein [Bacteroidetes bacterium]|nr:ATP-binding protein [Bacteroidota bacterium]
MAKEQLLKIAIVGPESTGKSVLSEQLAAHYACKFVPEVARAYIAKLNRPYLLEDIIEIARMQLLQEQALAKVSSDILICDTTLLVTKIWAQNAFNECPKFISEKYTANDYSLHLLMQIDLPWEYDAQREHPERREFFFSWYERELRESNANYCIISGSNEHRLKRAIAVIDAHLASFG